MILQQNKLAAHLCLGIFIDNHYQHNVTFESHIFRVSEKIYCLNKQN